MALGPANTNAVATIPDRSRPRTAPARPIAPPAPRSGARGDDQQDVGRCAERAQEHAHDPHSGDHRADLARGQSLAVQEQGQERERGRDEDAEEHEQRLHGDRGSDPWSPGRPHPNHASIALGRPESGDAGSELAAQDANAQLAPLPQRLALAGVHEAEMLVERRGASVTLVTARIIERASQVRAHPRTCSTSDAPIPFERRAGSTHIPYRCASASSPTREPTAIPTQFGPSSATNRALLEPSHPRSTRSTRSRRGRAPRRAWIRTRRARRRARAAGARARAPTLRA